jgi:FkbM family methyltransferase
VQLRDEADLSVFNEIFKLHEYRIADEVIQTAKHPILDIGAHAGFFTLHARSLNKTIPIFAVEPEPKNIKTVHKHLKENNITGVTVIEAALAVSSGSRTLSVTSDSHNHHLAEFTDEASAIIVKTFSFADLLEEYKFKKVSLLKMDIEGGEYEVFDSIFEAELAVVNYIILEYHNGREKSKEIEAKLRENGFSVQIFPSKFDKTMGFIFAHNKRFKS